MTRLKIENVTFFQIPTKTRFPFKYGIASMTEVPHLFAQIEMLANDRPGVGIASEGLPPKWFTKNPESRFEEDDLPEMLRVIGHAAKTLTTGLAAGEPGSSFFEIWEELHEVQSRWAERNGIPSLLSNLGVALMERALLDGLCRITNRPAWRAIYGGDLGIELGRVDPELKGKELSDVLPEQPLDSVIARHTVGLGDALTDDGILADELANDGLPQSLVASIRHYGLQHFKIKVSGNIDSDLDRLRNLAGIFETEAPPDYQITLDGNEQFTDIDTFREHWSQWRDDDRVRALLDRAIFVEQPLHRDVALSDSVRRGLSTWNDAPKMIIDESDADLPSLPIAFQLGYAGTSHKNCKGIIKGLVNAARVATRPGPTILSGEDLANLGPVALLQDLAMMALLGIRSVERNGHHYFRGLSMFPANVQRKVTEQHSDLYEFPTANDTVCCLVIREGELDLQSVNAAPFGCAPKLDLETFAEPRPLDAG
jgi:hypothetical protein